MAPLAAAVGRMVAPALIYVALTSAVDPAELSRGWAIPCATDIAFSVMIARVIFRSGQPAIPFLSFPNNCGYFRSRVTTR
jgi:NhaA family Na+:H+ antiporter